MRPLITSTAAICYYASAVHLMGHRSIVFDLSVHLYVRACPADGFSDRLAVDF